MTTSRYSSDGRDLQSPARFQSMGQLGVAWCVWVHGRHWMFYPLDGFICLPHIDANTYTLVFLGDYHHRAYPWGMASNLLNDVHFSEAF